MIADDFWQGCGKVSVIMLTGIGWAAPVGGLGCWLGLAVAGLAAVGLAAAGLAAAGLAVARGFP